MTTASETIPLFERGIRVFDRWLPRPVVDVAAERWRGRLVVLFFAISLVSSVGYSLSDVAAGRFPPIGSFVAPLVMLAAVGFMWRLGSTVLAGHIVCGLLCLTAVLYLLEMGGVRSTSFSILLLVPISSFALLSFRAAYAWCAVGAVIAAVFFMLDYSGVTLTPGPGADVIGNRNLVAVIVVLTLTTMWFAYSRDQVRNERLRTSERLRELRRQRLDAHAVALTYERTQRQFLHSIDREIRTPLNSLVGAADLLAGEQHNATSSELSATLHESGHALVHVVNDLLHLAESEAGVVELVSAPVDLEGLCRSLVSATSSQVDPALVTVTLDFDAHSWVVGDAQRLRQVLENLLSNATKFTQAGTVRLVVRSEGDQTVFSVADTGPGIDPSQLERIFEPFVQCDASTTRRFGGTGLGLAICRELATLMNGTVTATSTPDTGSVFTFSAPLPPTDGAPSLPGRVSLGRPKTPGTSTGLVLVAEDNIANQQVIGQMLTRLGYTHVLTSNGAEAVEAFASSRFDVVLMDCHMPIMDGFEATARIRDSPEGRDVPIIAVTADATAGNRRRCREAGMLTMVAKPITVGKLRQVLDGLQAGE